MKDQRERKNTGKRKNPDSHRKVSAFNAVIYFGLIIIADVFLLFSHSRPFSENENRMLQQVPALTTASLTSGKFMKQFENFTADQFFYRDGWIYSKLKMDKLLGRKMSNGVYLGGQGYLIEDTAIVNDSGVERNINAINHFSVSHPTIRKIMTIVPNSSEVNQSLVPAGAPIRDQSEDIGRIRDSLGIDIQFVDLLNTLKGHSSEQLYYKSDHHWTSLGAKYAFEEIAGALQIDPDRQFTAMTVADDFSGTMAATSGDFGVTDTVEIYAADPEVEYYVEYAGDPVKYSSIYDSSALENKNKYEVFFGGNYPKVTITVLNDTGRNLMVLKDSYANCFIQFLLPYFDRIVMVDPRYYSDDLEEEITSSEITDLLILYNENTFVQDNSLAGVLDPAV